MKNLNLKNVVVAAMLATVLIVACSGIAARENVLMPAMSAVYSTTISPLVQRGAEGEHQVLTLDVAMQEALDSGERELVATVDWGVLRAAALVGVDLRLAEGSIGPGVAATKVGAVNDFSVALVKLLSR